MKRETGENPVRTRHRVLQAEATDPLGDREGELDASERSAGRPAFRSTGTKKFRPRGIGSTKWITELYVV